MQLIEKFKLHTVCQEALCPNISECFSKKKATFLILGNKCTRNCKFCGIKKEKPLAVDEDEPYRIAKSVSCLGLRHVVITSVTRDDLSDGGAYIYYETVNQIKNINKNITVEVLVPDFNGSREAIKKVLESDVSIFAHNLETVPSLYSKVRQMADYNKSLKVLVLAKEIKKNIFTKSGLMLGLGEKDEEVMGVFSDLKKVKCDFLSIGQYLTPSLKHYPVQEYISPDKFMYFENIAKSMGFLKVASAPYVRSSYM